MIFTYEVDGQAVSLQLERLGEGRYMARLGEQTWHFTAQALPAGGYRLRLDDGTSALGHVARRSEERLVHLDGVQYRLGRSSGRARGSKRSGHEGDLTAQMPGQVLEVRVQVGERVQAGQVLLVLEAMKMEIRVTATADGVIRRLLVEKGQVVERGQLLAELGDEAS